MPDLPLPQQLYLGGVLCAFAVFMAALAWAYVQANRRPAQPRRGWRSAGAGEGGQSGAVGEAQAAGTFQGERA